MKSFAIVAGLCVLLGSGRSAFAWQAADYAVGGQDVVTVTVFDHPNLSGKFTIEADGAFTFPLIGRVKAGGLTPRAIEEEISTRLRAGYIKNPQISVTVDQYRSQRIFVIGAVAQPGTYVLSGNTTLIEALSRAGSTTNDAVGEAMIVRARPGRDVAGPVLPENAPDGTVVRIDLKQLESGSLSQNIRLADGDTIVVPRGEQVFLLGEVRSPGSYAVGKGTSVLQLLALGGGVTERGATGRIKIVRSSDGKKSETKVKLDDLVQPGDTVVVPEKVLLMAQHFHTPHVPPEDGSTIAPKGAPPELAEERHFVDYLRVLSKRRWTAIPVFLAVAIILLIPTFTATPLYEASGQLLIEADTQNVVTFKAVVEQDAATLEFYQTQYKILESRALARVTIDSLQLWNHPEFGGETPGKKPVDNRSRLARALGVAVGAVHGSLTRLMGGIAPEVPVRNAPDSETPDVRDESAEHSRVVAAFLERLTIAPVRNSRLVDVRFRSTDPKLAADVANALSQAYIRQTQDTKYQASKDATDWLGNQLSEQRKEVESTELALQKYREQNDAISTEDPQVTQKLAELNTAVTRAKTDRIYKETLYNQLQRIENDPAALATFPPVLNNSFVQQLRSELSVLQRQEADLAEKFGPLYPQLIEVRAALKAAQLKIQRETANIVEAIRAEYETAKTQEERLTAALDTQKAEALTLNRKSIGYRSLERDAASNRQIFESLLQRTKETTISGELKTNSIRIADAADIPRSPVWPQKRRNFLFAICAGALLGIVLAFFVEYMDNKIKTPDDIKWDLGVTCLGIVPKISYKPASGGSPLLNNGVPPNFSEAFRSLRTNVLFSVNGGNLNALVVTSTAPGEGKTLIASNLAVGLALAGQRVLLMDADMRRPRVHSVFSLAQQPGLSDLMIDQTRKVADVIAKCSVPNLWVLPAGHLPPNPAELLSSRRFSKFLEKVREQFDWVVIDSPPVMAVTDASILAYLASGVLFVTAADVTNRPGAVRAMEQLAAAKAKLIGAVLNRADVERNAYFYAPYYRNEYQDYYSSSPSHS